MDLDFTKLEAEVQKSVADLKAVEKRLDALQAACKMTLLFHSASPWDASKRIQWNKLRRQIIKDCDKEIFEDATTKVLCDAVRAALAELERE